MAGELALLIAGSRILEGFEIGICIWRWKRNGNGMREDWRGGEGSGRLEVLCHSSRLWIRAWIGWEGRAV